ncbi:hypothetical protein NWF24_17700 [Variovorax paradoxus]|uniref:hypothetical protein n=1 Tax=Variovorax paradoxus TaxID=34073 RepID=UPI0021ABD75D|nr:hypothetical protein [Variovorax paradoxus]UVH54681.1 hypothetical protein NWF24_17700 [Variovorax paradoxus]
MTNTLKVADTAQSHFLSITNAYSTRLISRADIIARTRNGTTIDIGDLDRAKKQIANGTRISIFVAMIASGLVGAGISNGAQNFLDAKSGIYTLVFGIMLIVGALVAWFTSRPR